MGNLFVLTFLLFTFVGHGNCSTFMPLMNNDYSIPNFFSFQSQFSSFSPFLSKFNADNFDYNELKDSDFIFMRWKVGGIFLVIHYLSIY